MLRSISSLYVRANEKSPIVTQSVSAGIIASIGDVSMQLLEQRQSAGSAPHCVEWERTGRLATYRATFFAPCYVLWLRLMERAIGKSGPGVVAKKVFLDQALWTPPSMTVLYGWMGLAEHAQERIASHGGIVTLLRVLPDPAVAARNAIFVLREGLRRGYERAHECLWPTLRVNWPVWGVVGFVTYGLVPLHMRVIWVSSVQVGWNAFLSGLNERSRQVASADVTADISRSADKLEVATERSRSKLNE